MLIQRAEVDGRAGVDVRIAGDSILEIGAGLTPLAGEGVLDAEGGALLPGLHDHHIHLYALAASLASVRCGPPEVTTPHELARAVSRATPRGDGWIRGVAYHDSVAGALDRHQLDALSGTVPLRIQHRSGALWMLNSAGLAQLGLTGAVPSAAPPGVERDDRGHATGRFFRTDAWLRERWPSHPPDIAPVGTALARVGVTGVTDATATNGAEELHQLAEDIATGRLPQRVRVMGSAALPQSNAPGIERGERKIVLAEHDLPPLEELRDVIAEAHQSGRGVAIHCVTRTELVLAAGALAAAGTSAGDRIEHAAIAPPDLATLLAELHLCVVTQPNFIRERGDVYLSEVAKVDLPWLYRCGGLLARRIAVAGGTDAPFGDPNPWLAMQAAVDRRSAHGKCIGDAERVTPERALALFTSRPDAPGAAPRTLAPGATADLCLLDQPWGKARTKLECTSVRATVARGALVFDAANA